ncbi:MAG TPA: hypothetical protein VE954_22970 [Oligoflexus sp.]|uniref:hypothetical protein n=1 Tax=Oligoflexus sp. TaxID=1971216 RepID=UPI002D333F7D|nr:hypothetical protein [Oligoflexus sp.]HYX35974.1 hypothetical protein [Oligoflexus sp.]
MGKRVPQDRTYQSFVSGLWLLLPLLLLGCSESTNIMGLIAASSVEQDAAALLSRSRIRMDSGDYENALRDAEAAVALAPDCGACAVQAGYCHLGVAGLDMFQLARKMIEENATEEDEPTLRPAVDGEESGNASGQLGSLASLVGLGATDYEAITLPGNRLGDLEGAPATGPFRALPVYLPKNAVEARASDSSTLLHIARAVAVICPFMPANVKVLGDNPDIRHAGDSCVREQDVERTYGNSLFIWAVAHLVEAIAFHQVVLYTQDGAIPNLQKRAAILENRSEITSLTEYIKAVKDLASVVDIILPTEIAAARASMLTAMFNDLQTVSLAFQHMAAVPADLSKGIVDAIAELQGQKDKIGSSGGSSTGEKHQGAVAFKDQLTEGMATELKKQITSKIDSGALSEQERTDLCSAYRQISTQSFASCDTP